MKCYRCQTEMAIISERETLRREKYRYVLTRWRCPRCEREKFTQEREDQAE